MPRRVRCAGPSVFPARRMSADGKHPDIRADVACRSNHRALPWSVMRAILQVQVNLRSSMKLADIAGVARRSGVPASTLRFYDEKGLIRSVGRRGTRRLLDHGVLERCP